MTNRWLLPENIADVLPGKSNLVELLRREILDLFQSYGYELVIPPMMEYIESLMTATGSDSRRDFDFESAAPRSTAEPWFYIRYQVCLKI